MELPPNHFKQALREGRPQIGLWSSLADAYATEVVAGAGFDWIMLDTEHAPNDVPRVLAQLQVLAAYPVSAVVRPDWNDTVLIKRYLDIGAQTLLLPCVQSAEEARAAVRAVRYPPEGVRGAGGATVRATRFGRVDDYMRRCNDEICLLVQVESREALAAVDEIAAVDGVDGVFIGPADLSSSLGHTGNPGHPEVLAAIDHALDRIRAAGKAPGILMTDEARAQRYLEAGALFVAVGIDLTLLARQTEALARRFGRGGRDPHAAPPAAAGGAY